MLATLLSHSGRLPAPVLAIMRQLAFIVLYYLPGYRRKVVARNIQRALPELPAAQQQDITRDYYKHLARLITEVLQTPHMAAEAFEDAVSLTNPEVAAQCSDNFTRSIVFISIHQGNWEWMLHGISTHLGLNLNPLYQPLHNTSADHFMHRVRSHLGSSPIAVEDAGSHILRNRRRPYAIAVLADQAPLPDAPAKTTQFMGQQTAFHSGFTQLLRITNAAVVYVRCTGVGRGKYAVEFHAMPETPNEREPEQALIDWYATMAEQSIREQPHTWLWSHNRWKHAER